MENINIDEAVVIVGTIPIKNPSEYSINVTTLVDGQRNTNGVMIGEEIRGGVLRVDLMWNYLKSDEWAEILRLFTGTRTLDTDKFNHLEGKFVNDVIILDPETNTRVAKKMYVSDRQSKMHRIIEEYDVQTNTYITKAKGWLECKLSLIEV